MASQLDNVVRLSYREKVPVGTMKEIIAAALQERLQGAQYEGEKCGEAARGLADTIRNRLKSKPKPMRNLGYDRYKFCVQVLIGERRDQGVRMGSRCFWDSATDSQASETFMNDHIFCVATVYATYLY